jgi:hypothetical protein
MFAGKAPKQKQKSALDKEEGNVVIVLRQESFLPVKRAGEGGQPIGKTAMELAFPTP